MMVGGAGAIAKPASTAADQIPAGGGDRRDASGPRLDGRRPIGGIPVVLGQDHSLALGDIEGGEAD